MDCRCDPASTRPSSPPPGSGEPSHDIPGTGRPSHGRWSGGSQSDPLRGGHPLEDVPRTCRTGSIAGGSTSEGQSTDGASRPAFSTPYAGGFSSSVVRLDLEPDDPLEFCVVFLLERLADRLMLPVGDDPVQAIPQITGLLTGLGLDALDLGNHIPMVDPSGPQDAGEEFEMVLPHANTRQPDPDPNSDTEAVPNSVPNRPPNRPFPMVGPTDHP